MDEEIKDVHVEELVLLDSHSIEAREPVRSQIAADVEAFLAQGGAIKEVPRDFRADPPRRPESNYGRGSI
jgi:hypothetical protein